MGKGFTMSEGKAVSLFWLLGLLLVAIVYFGMKALNWLHDIFHALHHLNLSIFQWREQFSETFQYIDEDRPNATGRDLYGDEQEEER